jgi:hypothetical protein
LPVSTETIRAIDRYAAEFISVEFRHDQARSGAGINPLTWSLYSRLMDLARDPSTASDADIGLDLAQLALRFKSMSSTLALVDELEGELRRRGPSLHGMAMAAWKHLPTAATFADLRTLLRSRSPGRGDQHPVGPKVG